VQVFCNLAICSQQETDKKNILKDPEMLKHFNEIEKIEETDKGHILSVINGFVKSIKIKNIAALYCKKPQFPHGFVVQFILFFGKDKYLFPRI
jgi:hypothetical protein